MSVSERAPLPARIAGVIKRLRVAEPRVHLICGPLSQGLSTDMLLALGARPSVGGAPEDISDFVASADGLLIGMDALDGVSATFLEDAVRTADGGQIPWVLDPVMIDRSPVRCRRAAALLERRPTVLRADVAELLALVPPTETIAGFAKMRGTTVVLSGVVDTLSDGRRQYALANGHELLGRVPAMGSAMGAVMAAALAVEPDTLVAAAAGMSIVNIAGEIAAEKVDGPGSFAVALIDALGGLGAGELRQRLDATREKLEGTELVAKAREPQ